MPPRQEKQCSAASSATVALDPSSSESTPLLFHSPLSLEDASTDEELGIVTSEKPSCRASPPSILYDEMTGLLCLSIPVVATYIMEMLPGIFSIVLVGHIRDDLTEEYIDATALAVMFMNLTGLSVGFGLSSALDTLCSQAYGANETHKMGTYLQTGVLVLSAFLVLVCIIFYYCTEILIALGQPEVVSRLAGKFTLYLLPGVPFLFMYELLRKCLQAQNLAAPMFFVSALANLINIGLGYYLVYHSQWGWLGSALARTACNISFFALLLPYTVTSGLAKSFWTGIHLREAIEGIPEFLALGVPGMLQLCFEWWAFEVLSIVCGLLPNAVEAIGSNAVLLNISSMVYMFYLGLSISCNVRVGNALGAGDPERASLAARLTLCLSGTTAVLCATVLLLWRTSLPRLFTHDEEINDLAVDLICVSAVFQLPDALNAAVQGIFRGSGRQTLGAELNFVAYYMLGIPLGVWFAFGLGLGVVGLWLGMTAGLFLVAVCGTALISRSDWALLAKQAEERVRDV